MTTKSIDHAKETRTLMIETLEHREPGFVKSDNPTPEAGSLAKSVASAYMKFVDDPLVTREPDSVEQFIGLYQLHNTLTEQAQQYLKTRVTFVTEDQPIGDFLIGLAAFRQELALTRFNQAVDQQAPKAMIDDLQQAHVAMDAEYTRVTQAL